MKKPITRRSFLKIAAAAGPLVATDGCNPERGTKLIPYLVPEENVLPGVPAFYKTVCAECGAGCGVVARVREGRTIKLEGNPENPINAGALCARGQAALQGLYNPDRLTKPRRRKTDGNFADISWDEAFHLLVSECSRATEGGQIAFIGSRRGPSFHRVLTEFLKSFGSNRLCYYEPLNEEAALHASKECFSRADLPLYRIDKASVIVSFGADFLETWRSPLELSRQYSAFRNPRRSSARDELIGLSYYVGPRMSLTAAKSDYYLQCRVGVEAAIACAILRSMNDRHLLRNVPDQKKLATFLAAFDPENIAQRIGFDAADIHRIAEHFASASAALALAGTDDPEAHKAALLINYMTGNCGKTVVFQEGNLLDEPEARQIELNSLLGEMRAGKTSVLFIAGGNPEFSTSSELDFRSALNRVPLAVWCGTVPDETSAFCGLQLPIHHTLEEWSDYVPRPGVYSVGQPTMQPVFESMPIGELLIRVGRGAGKTMPWPDFRSAIQEHWGLLSGLSRGRTDRDEAWAETLKAGGVYSETRPATMHLNEAALESPPKMEEPGPGLTLLAYPHIFFYDGRGADKPWLQENPEPVAEFVWDSWLEIHPHTAEALGIRNNDVVDVNSSLGKIRCAATVHSRISPDAVAVPLGQGHTAYGRYASGRGANPWPILTPGKLHVPVTLKSSGKKHELISPLFTSDMMHRPIVEKITLDEVKRGTQPPPREPPPPKPYELWPKHVYKEHHWGMTIDVNACTGCGACVTACYAENNLNVVGKHGVQMGRIMSWLRLERYFPEDANAPQMYIMPMLCQQCDSAPCEPVCPVYASYHTNEGLNAQIYNRCVGTRFCENNCPYKVRRFNWFKPEFDAPLHLQLNPDVTVRGAGVMEKCTFCVQRIRAAEINAKVQDRKLRDGDIVPACAETCPTRAITFGDMLDDNSAIARKRSEHAIRQYRALEELNTRPSITYLRTIFRTREG